MSALDRLLPRARLVEIDRVDLAASPSEVWERVRSGDLGRSRLTRALFWIRTIPDRVLGREAEDVELRVDALRSTPDKPGFQILLDDPPREVCVGAIGKVWRLQIPFVHVADADAYASFCESGWVKVAWALRVMPLGDRGTRLEMEVRVDATDDASWPKFRAYFAVIGPASRWIRRTLLAGIARELGAFDRDDNMRPLPGDELLPDAIAQVTHGITIAAPPEAIWPWLVQMGCGRGGFYSIDALDNGGVASAREIDPELQAIEVGQVLPASPGHKEGFEVLRIDPSHALILGGLFDPTEKQQLPFVAPRPAKYWQVTWAFVLELLDAKTTRLRARARAAYPPSGRFHATWIRPVHALMQRSQLRHLAARAEGRLHLDTWRDIADGLRGAARIAFDFATPLSRRSRRRWGLDRATESRVYPGDDLVATPRWGWTHAIEIDAPTYDVWPWVAQIGADRAGFYSYQWLENLAGCKLRNAEAIHPEWSVYRGDSLRLHPSIPPLSVVRFEPGHHFVAYARPHTEPRGVHWVAASWLFLVEPLGDKRCRFVSRYRVDTSGDPLTRVSFGPFLIEPIGFEMDRKMLLGVKQRAEHRSGRVGDRT